MGGFAVLFRGPLIWTLLGFGAFVVETLEDFFDVAGHRNINSFVEIVPFKCNAAI